LAALIEPNICHTAAVNAVARDICARVAVVVLGASLAPGTLLAADLPVVASRLVTGPSSHVDLTNKSDQPVTAWSIVITTTDKDGTTRRATETVDAYLAEVTKDFAGMSAKVDRLQPGQTREIDIDPAGSGATAEVAVVVLQDGTALGDEETITSIFEHRASERDQLHGVIDVFDRVLPSASGIEALQRLQRGFAVQPPEPESPAHQSAREAIDAYLQRATPATADAIDKLLRQYADVIRREYELAEKHSHRKAA
jgi:hypothetical protein